MPTSSASPVEMFHAITAGYLLPRLWVIVKFVDAPSPTVADTCRATTLVSTATVSAATVMPVPAPTARTLPVAVRPAPACVAVAAKYIDQVVLVLPGTQGVAPTADTTHC